MTNKEWKDLISEEFNVSKSVAREMLHAMFEVKAMKDVNFACFVAVESMSEQKKERNHDE